jgi:hypothetical protein
MHTRGIEGIKKREREKEKGHDMHGNQMKEL